MAYDSEKTKKTKEQSEADNKTASSIIAKSKKAFSSQERTNVESIWKLLAEFILPNANGGFFGDHTKGIRRDARVFASVGSQSNRDLSSFLHATITNPAMDWSKLRFRTDALNNLPSAVKWMQDSVTLVHQHLNESNFNSEIGEVYQSLSALGTSVIFHEELTEDTQGRKFNFNTWHLSEIAYAENALGTVDTIYRKFTMTLKQLCEKFGDAVPSELQEKCEHSPLEEYHLIHGMYPRDKKDIKLDKTTGMSAPEHRAFASCYVLLNGKVLLLEDGYYEFPAYVPRWSTCPAEIYGYGPGHVALSDVRSINKVWEESLKALAKSVNPTIFTTKMNMLSADLRPGRVTQVRDVNQVKEFVTQSRMDMIQFAVENISNSIKAAFYIDKLLLPPRTETGEMTAYEVAQRLEQLQQIMGPTVSRFNDELLTPLVLRSIKILLRANVLPPMPQDMLAALPTKNGQKDLDFEIMFVNSLARSQQLAELRNVQTFIQESTGLAQLDQGQCLDLIDFDKVLEYSAEIREIPEQLLRSDDDVKALRDTKQKQQAQQQALMQAQQVGDVANKVAPLMQSQGSNVQSQATMPTGK